MRYSLTPPGSFPSSGELAMAIWRTQRGVERAADARLVPLGLRSPVARILRLLAHEPGQSAADLARRIGHAPQSVALAVEKAAAAGLIERRPHPYHGRVLTLQLTEAGHEAYQRVANVIASLERELSGDLDATARDLLWRQLYTITERAEALAREMPDSAPLT